MGAKAIDHGCVPGHLAVCGWALCSLILVGTAPVAAEQVRNLRSGEQFATIQQALGKAQPNDTLEVDSGRYSGALGIDKTIVLKGIDTGAGRPVIDGAGAPVAVQLAAPGITVEGFAITSSGAPKRPYGIFSSYAEEACVLARRSGGHVLRGNVIEGCHYGVYLLESHDTLIEDNDITGNSFGGVFIRNSRRDKVLANRVTSNGYDGIGVGTITFPPGAEQAFKQLAGQWWTITTDARPVDDVMSEEIEITGNTVTGHGLGGIAVGYARAVTVADNSVSDNGGAKVPKTFPEVSLSLSDKVHGFGIAFNCDGYEHQVLDNDVRQNTNTGILFDSAHLSRIATNSVTTSEYGILVLGSHGNSFEANRVFGNTGTGIRLERGAAVQSPSVGNLLVRNDLTDNAVNAFDTSGKDVAPARVQGQPKGGGLSAAELKTPNRWDDGAEGNHYSDFDETSEGFVDQDGDGIGEKPHPIPGGAAVDHVPLSLDKVGGAGPGSEIQLARTSPGRTVQACANGPNVCGTFSIDAGKVTCGTAQ